MKSLIQILKYFYKARKTQCSNKELEFIGYTDITGLSMYHSIPYVFQHIGTADFTMPFYIDGYPCVVYGNNSMHLPISIAIAEAIHFYDGAAVFYYASIINRLKLLNGKDPIFNDRYCKAVLLAAYNFDITAVYQYLRQAIDTRAVNAEIASIAMTYLNKNYIEKDVCPWKNDKAA